MVVAEKEKNVQARFPDRICFTFSKSPNSPANQFHTVQKVVRRILRLLNCEMFGRFLCVSRDQFQSEVEIIKNTFSFIVLRGDLIILKQPVF